MTARVEDDATDRWIDSGFKIFRRLLLELHPKFDIGYLEAHFLDEVINKVMDELEREKIAAREVAGPSRSSAGLRGSNPTELGEMADGSNGERK